MRIMGLLVMIPASMLLTASFFVLFAIEKAREKDLKMFGKIVAAVLIIVSSLIFSKGLYIMVTGECPMMKTMQKMCPMGKGVGHMGMERGMMHK